MARIICLANSVRPGGSCMAGIDLQTGKWVRPVPDTRNRAITASMMLTEGKTLPEILDVLEIPLEDFGPDDGCQPENRLLKLGKWKKVGRITAKDLLQYCEDDTVILHNHTDHVVPGFFGETPKNKWKSLQLVRNSEVQFISAYKEGQWRASFKDGCGHTLNLKLTDPVVSQRLRRGDGISRDCMLVISLTTPWKPQGEDRPELCYKLVAGVVEL